MADIIADMQAYSNQALLDVAAWAGVGVWIVIGAIAGAVLLLLILVVWLIERKHEAPVSVYAGERELEFVEKTIAEFPADQIRIEGKKGKVVIKLISQKPAAREETLPQEVKGEPLPTKAEEVKPPAQKEPEKKEEPKSKPIAMGAVGAPPEKPEETK